MLLAGPPRQPTRLRTLGGGGTAYASAEPSWRLHGCLSVGKSPTARRLRARPRLWSRHKVRRVPCRAVGEAAQNNKPGLCEVVPADYCGAVKPAPRHNPLKSSNTSPNFLITLASLKSPVAGSPVRLNATAPTDVDLCSGPCFGFARHPSGPSVSMTQGRCLGRWCNICLDTPFGTNGRTCGWFGNQYVSLGTAFPRGTMFLSGANFR